VEWFFSTRELCALMAEVRGQPLMQVNPGVANPEDWETISFKGGSEPGVLNLTTALTAPMAAPTVFLPPGTTLPSASTKPPYLCCTAVSCKP
jgi:hypothetical protein